MRVPHARRFGSGYNGVDRLPGVKVFTRTELMTELPRWLAAPTPPLKAARFGQQSFTPPESEQSVEGFWGAKRDFAGPLHFWLKALQAQDWTGRESVFVPYAESGLCLPLTGAEFARLVAEHIIDLLEPLPPFLTDLSGIRTGLRMSADWNDVAAVAESDDSFIAFFWSTTA
jgi:hypothetical protein